MTPVHGSGPQVGRVLAQAPAVAQKLSGVERSESSVSMRRSQSLSTPSQTSGPLGVQAYSQPLASSPSASVKPVRHATMVQVPPLQPLTAFGRSHGVQPPQ